MPSDLSRLAALEDDGRDPKSGRRTTSATRSGRSRGVDDMGDHAAGEPVVVPHRPGAPVPDGPLANRRSIRRLGALAGLVAPLVSGAVGALLLWGSTTGWRGLPGFVLVVAAVPVLPMTGVPAEGGETRYIVAIAVSAVLWLVIGAIAARRATRSPVATWDDWRDEYRRLALGAALGGAAALGLSWLIVDLGLV